MQHVSQAGWSFRLEHLPSHQSCCLYKHFIRNFHQLTCSLRLYRHTNNDAKRMLRLLNAGAKINFYEPSCSVNTAWHLNFVQESPGGDSLTLHSNADCAVLHVCSMCCGQGGPDHGAEPKGEETSKNPVALKWLHVSLGKFYFPLF